VFYDSFIKLCEEIGISPTRVVVESGLSKGSFTRWKDGGEPRNEAKKRMADIMGITVPELMAGEIKKPAIENDDGISNAEAEFIKVWRQVPEDKRQMLQDMIIADLKSKGLL
jgi:hypothetical protein